MPELPEVETTLRGISPHVSGQKISNVIVRCKQLRWPIPNLKKYLLGQTIKRLWRRGKYILFEFEAGTLILHLGMSGRLRIFSKPMKAQKHDHVDIYFENNKFLRFTDPRRFGALLWTTDDPQTHGLLATIGPEPLDPLFNGDYLWQKSCKKKATVKAFLMDSKTIAGIGNIYATEALFQACINPQKPAGKISRVQYQQLVEALKMILQNAIAKGGTTLKDFTNSEGAPGYFSIELKAYGQGGNPCPRCHTTFRCIRIAQRSTVYCPQCQK
jgi:formamidopyrimidine-DNA glycosylase